MFGSCQGFCQKNNIKTGATETFWFENEASKAINIKKTNSILVFMQLPQCKKPKLRRYLRSARITSQTNGGKQLAIASELKHVVSEEAGVC